MGYSKPLPDRGALVSKKRKALFCDYHTYVPGALLEQTYSSEG